MNTFKERMESLQGNRSLSALAEELGISVSTVRNYLERGSVPRADVAIQIADAMGVNARWLVTGEGPMRDEVETSGPIGGTERGNATFIADTVDIPRLDVRASAGDGAAGATGEAIEFMPFPRAWLKAKGLNPATLRIVDVAGDSMEPTLGHGDIILVDTAVRRIRGEALYVIVRDDDVYVKRAQKRMNGSILIASDNERYPPEELTEKDAEKLHVAGRVVWFGRSI